MLTSDPILQLKPLGKGVLHRKAPIQRYTFMTGDQVTVSPKFIATEKLNKIRR